VQPPSQKELSIETEHRWIPAFAGMTITKSSPSFVKRGIEGELGKIPGILIQTKKIRIQNRVHTRRTPTKKSNVSVDPGYPASDREKT
jgi:hypothetical protein